MVKNLFVLVIILSISLSSCKKDEDVNVSKQETTGFTLSTDDLGTITTKKVNDTYVHLYHGTDLAQVNSFAIETKDKVVVIDALHFQSRANEMRNFVNFLGKSVERVIISHGHADHYMGLGVFADLPTYATSEAITNITNEGEPTRLFRISLGEPFASEYPESVTIPSNTIESSFTVDGISYEDMNYTNTEAKDEMIIKIPSLKMVHTADLVDDGGHKIIIDPTAFINSLNEIKALKEDGYDTILTGHNGFESFDVLDSNIAYLNASKLILDTNPTAEEYQIQIEAAYPQYGDAAFVVQLMALEGVFN